MIEDIFWRTIFFARLPKKFTYTQAKFLSEALFVLTQAGGFRYTDRFPVVKLSSDWILRGYWSTICNYL